MSGCDSRVIRVCRPGKKLSTDEDRGRQERKRKFIHVHKRWRSSTYSYSDSGKCSETAIEPASVKNEAPRRESEREGRKRLKRNSSVGGFYFLFFLYFFSLSFSHSFPLKAKSKRREESVCAQKALGACAVSTWKNDDQLRNSSTGCIYAFDSVLPFFFRASPRRRRWRKPRAKKK